MGLSAISKGYAAVTRDGEKIGQVEFAEVPSLQGGQVIYDRFWFGGDIHSGTYGHQSDRIERSIGRFPTRRAAAAAVEKGT